MNLKRFSILTLVSFAYLFFFVNPKEFNTKKVKSHIKIMRIHKKNVKVTRTKSVESHSKTLEHFLIKNAKELNNIFEVHNIQSGHLLEKIQNDGINQAISKFNEKEQILLKKLYREIKNKQDEILALDGMTRDDIKRHQDFMPKKIEQRLKELQNIELPKNIQNTLDEISDQNELNDENIYALIEQCNYSKDCVEKTFQNLLDQNFSLSQRQLDLIYNSELM